jgi:hypothetical protein|tara:strand:+ start:434 stop:613 length:180 start_codon:yes stop_codon:yes gene_type:complete
MPMAVKNQKTIFIAGSPNYTGAVLVRKYLKAGHTIKVQEGYTGKIFLVFLIWLLFVMII